MEQWELLVIDNCSKEPLSIRWDLSWHSRAFHIREETIGLTQARLRGIREATGEYLVFVDDDNLLEENYLYEVATIFGQWPKLGAIGASVKGEFEVPPPSWISPYLEGLAICELDRDYWSNSIGWSRATPVGAGLCVRSVVATDYLNKVTNSRSRLLLGRSGAGMGAGEDSDLAWCAIDLGMGTGRFMSLRLTHLIPRDRLTEDYIVRLYTGFEQAHEMLSSIRSTAKVTVSSQWKNQVRLVLNVVTSKGVQRRIWLGAIKARNKARLLLAKESAAPLKIGLPHDIRSIRHR